MCNKLKFFFVMLAMVTLTLILSQGLLYLKCKNLKRQIVAADLDRVEHERLLYHAVKDLNYQIDILTNLVSQGEAK